MKNLNFTLALLLVLGFTRLSAQSNMPVSVSNDDGLTTLEWSTQKEVNSSYFVIESSNDNLNFTTIAKVKAAGYSLTNKSYQLENLHQNLYYRVTLVSMEGERLSAVATNLLSEQSQMALK